MDVRRRPLMRTKCPHSLRQRRQDAGGHRAALGLRAQLLNDKGAVVDTVKYDDASPWPVGADAFGAQDEFLAADLAGDKHVFMGRSLERWSYTVPATEARNWEASPVDGATPGRANSISGEPPAIALEVTARPEGVDGLIKKSHKVRIAAKLSSGAVKDLRVEYFVDVIDKTDEPKMSEVMTMTAGEWTATLPVQADNAIVRYRVLGVRGSGVMPEPLSIRGGDPFTHQAYFVSPDVPQVRAHHVFISVSNWTKNVDEPWYRAQQGLCG